MKEPVIVIMKYDPSQHRGVLEFEPERTVVHIGSLCMSVLLSRDDFEKFFLPDGIWLAIIDHVTIGAILIGSHYYVNSRWVATYGIKVDEPYRRRGIGSQLMQRTDEFAHFIGIERLFVETHPDNIPALALFHKCGYKVFESFPDNVKLEKRLI